MRIVCYIMLFLILSAEKGNSSDSSLFSGKAEYQYGFDVSGTNAYSYANLTIAPLGQITETGLRLRVNTGIGIYSYKGNIQVGNTTVPSTFSATLSTAELMMGYYSKLLGWDAKAFLGVNYTDHYISPFDPNNEVQGDRFGFRTQIELWRNIGTNAWFSGDLSYSTTYGDYWGQIKAGHKILQNLDLGIEAAAFGNDNYSAGRIGVLGIYRTDYGDIAVSGGFSGNYNEEMEPYLGVSLFRRF